MAEAHIKPCSCSTTTVWDISLAGPHRNALQFSSDVRTTVYFTCEMVNLWFLIMLVPQSLTPCLNFSVLTTTFIFIIQTWTEQQESDAFAQ